MTALNENPEHCHQRPESGEKCAKYGHIPESYDISFWHCKVCGKELNFYAPENTAHQRPETCNECGEVGPHFCEPVAKRLQASKYPERPESDWRAELNDMTFFTRGDIEAFVARQRDSEYQRGYDEGVAEWYKDEEYQRGLAEGARQEREQVVHRLDSILAAYSNDRPVPPTVLRQFQDSLTTPTHNESV